MPTEGGNLAGRIVSRQEQERLWRLAVTGDRDAADALVRCCLPKIRQLAGQYDKKARMASPGAPSRPAAGGEADDLQQIGCLQVFKAIPFYKPERGSFFNFGVHSAARKMQAAADRARDRKMAVFGWGDGESLVPDRNTSRAAVIEGVSAALARLSPVDRLIIDRREAAPRHRTRAADLARELGITTRRLEAIHAAAVNKLSDLLADLAP